MSSLTPLDLSEFVTNEPIDLTNCDREPIHIPGLIQPHGVLLTLCEPQLDILQVSDNTDQFLGIPAQVLLGKPLTHLFSRSQVAEITKCLQQDSLDVFNPLELELDYSTAETTSSTKSYRYFWGVIHRSSGLVILELEPKCLDASAHHLKFYPLLRAAIAKIRNAETLTDLLTILAQEIRRITQVDRAMIYRFEPDGHGAVVAEDADEKLESYLGLHYPASDIPKQARKLYYTNWLRIIPNISYQPVPVIPSHNPLTGEPLDLSASTLRSVSPIHVEYLQNMGVTASVCISLINEKHLWGLIVCHHYQAKYIDYDTRKACEFLGQFASVELIHQQDRENQHYRNQVKAIQDEFRAAFTQEVGLIEAVLQRNETALLNLVHAQGVAIALDGQISLLRQTPTEEQVQDLMNWLIENHRQETFCTHSLVKVYPPAQAFTTQASGMLAISILLHQKSYHLLWFRPEQIQVVNWAGNPHKPVSVAADGTLRLTPRKSFDAWKETVRATSIPWQIAELEAALEMRNTLMLAVLEFSQAALEQTAERAAIANRAKSQFLAKMSHELRTPLNAILGFTQLMNHSSNLSLEFREHLGIISRSGEHLLTLINDVLEMSKIEAGQLELTESCFDLHRMFYALQEMFALKTAKKGLTLSLDLSSDVPRYVKGDEAKFRQILINLLNNAIKFTQSGSVILRMRSLPKALSSAQPAKRNLAANSASSSEGSGEPSFILNCEIEDTGCGIATEDLERIFEAFMQTEQGRHAQGTGLGLSISRQFARLMGGDITVQSTLRQGSIFTCQIKLHPVEVTDLVTPEVSYQVVGLEPGQPIYRILVAEDTPENRQLLLTLLNSVGFEVCTVENGAEAIAYWQEWQPHLILMDIQMPVMNGYEAVQQIRAQPQGEEVVIIALTAYAFAEDQDISLEAGCNDYIAKPFSESVLFKRIAHHLGLRYCYAQPPVASTDPNRVQKTLTSEDFQIMPPEWIVKVHEAAMTLRDTKLYQLISEIPSEGQDLAITLKHLVDNFQLEAIATLTQP